MTDSSRQPNPPPSPFAQGSAPAENPDGAPLEPPRTSWFESLLLCVISRDFYVEVLRRWKGLGLVYLFCVLALVSIPGAMKIQMDQARGWQTMREKIVPQMPVINVQSGRASVEGTQPLTIYLDGAEKKGVAVALLDTTGNFGDLSNHREIYILSHSSLYVFLGEPGKYMDFPLPVSSQKSVLDKNWLSRIIGFCEVLSTIITYPLLIISSFLFWTLHALMLAGLSKLMMVGPRLNAKFGDILRLCIIGCTPAIYLNTLALLADIRWEFWSMVLAVVVVIYVTSALRAAAEDALRREEEEQNARYRPR